MASTRTLPPCHICAHPADKRCSGCKEVSYCSPEHQKQGWPKHRKLCKIYQQLPPPSIDSYCGLCGNTGNLTTTECCGRAICDDQDAYKPFSYSTVSCSRNHRRYTMCAYHHTESHPSEKWQDCQKCKDDTRALEDLVHKGTSSFNFREDKWENVPMFEPTKCKACSKVIKLGSEGHGCMPGGGMQCMACMGGWDAVKGAARMGP